MDTESYTTLRLETSDGAGGAGGAGGGTVASMAGILEGTHAGGSSAPPEEWHMPYPISFQVSLTSFLMLELVLGFSSNLTVLVLYCSQSNLVDSVSNLVTVNLHVLDIAVCVLCLPLTVVVVLLPPGRDLALVCCFHEACVTFASISTAINVLVISMDRYDISVRPANRLLTPRYAALLLAAVWAVSLAVFFIPFIEVDFFSSSSSLLSEGVGENGVGGVTQASVSTQSPSSPLSLSPSSFSSSSSSSSPYPSLSPSPASAPAWRNRTLLCVGGQGYHMGLGMYTHLLLQVPIFFATVVVMLFTYSRILRALNIKIGSHMRKGHQRGGASGGGGRRHRSVVGVLGCRGRRIRRKNKQRRAEQEELEGAVVIGGDSSSKHLSHPPLISSPTPTTPTPATSPPAVSTVPLMGAESTAASAAVSTAASPVAPVAATAASSLGVQASVSAIIALRRAVRRHRDRRERQRRVFRMSLLIISTFLGCWAPISVANVLILCLGPSDTLVSLRLCFLAMAYGTTISHPLLYAFTRQKLRRVLRAKVKKRVVSLLQVDPSPGGTVIHNSWVEPPRKGGRKGRVEGSDGTTDRCLSEPL